MGLHRRLAGGLLRRRTRHIRELRVRRGGRAPRIRSRLGHLDSGQLRHSRWWRGGCSWWAWSLSSAAAVAGIGALRGARKSDLALAARRLARVGCRPRAARRSAAENGERLVGDFLDTPTAHAIIRRGAAIAIAGVALAVAWRAPRARRGALLVAAIDAIAAIAFHVGAGHAAAGPWPSALTITAQTAHFAAAGIWFGGLAALLVGIRGEPSAETGAAVRRFAIVAAVALVVVVATGTLRAIDELSSFGQLFTTGYGRAILAKLVLVGVIAGIAARNRRSVAAAATELRPLRRRAGLELGLAAVALAVAALMGTLAPGARRTGRRARTYRRRHRLELIRPGEADHGGVEAGSQPVRPADDGLGLGRASSGPTGQPALHPGRRPGRQALHARAAAGRGRDLCRLGIEPEVRRPVGG